jgi:hypothetical protein
MKARITRNAIRSATALALCAGSLGWSHLADAQTVVVRPPAGEQPAPPPQAPFVVVNGSAPAFVPEPVILPEPVTPLRLVTRPSRTRLTTGLIAFGQSYIASIGIAATSHRRADSALWLPMVGPWLDLGARPACAKAAADCGPEIGIKVLLAADGILQTFGVFEIVGAFLWPETVAVPTITTGSGASLSLRPSRVGQDGYGISGIGRFW